MLLERGATDLDAGRLVMGVAVHHRHQEVRTKASSAVRLLVHELALLLVLLSPLALRLDEALLLLVQLAPVMGQLAGSVQVVGVGLRLRSDVLDHRVVHLWFSADWAMSGVVEAMVEHLVSILVVLELARARSALVAVVVGGVAGRRREAYSLADEVLALVLATSLLYLLAPVHYLGLLGVVLVQVHLIVAVAMTGGACSTHR